MPSSHFKYKSSAHVVKLNILPDLSSLQSLKSLKVQNEFKIWVAISKMNDLKPFCFQFGLHFSHGNTVLKDKTKKYMEYVNIKVKYILT